MPIPGDEESGSMWEYNDLHINSFVNVLGTTLASLLPLSSIFVLYLVKNLLIRLGVITAFTMAFSLTLSILTQSRRIEIFAATTALVIISYWRSKRSKTNNFSLDMLLFKWCLWVVPTALKPKESIVSLITHLYSLDFCFYFFTFPCKNSNGKLAPTNVAFFLKKK